MPTNYPNSLDNFTNPTGNDFLNSVTVPHHQQHTNANDAIEAIEGELGISPSGAFATVADRLNDIESNFSDFIVDGGTFWKII